MKKQLAFLSLALAAASFSTLGQGYLTFGAATGSVWDEFTNPGVGVRANSNVNVAFLWAASGTSDPLPPVTGSPFQPRLPPPNQVATNGVSSLTPQWGTINSMLSSGWSWGRNNSDGSMAIASGSAGSFSYNSSVPFTLQGSAPGATYEIIAVGWDAAAGATPGNSMAMGWSIPFNYLTGTSAFDPNGVALFNNSGMNPFGVAAVPEPSTLAVMGLGGLSLLLFRRRK